ncbi:uncharacterized protein [Hoplias malabaricus]|uniref:uncharacterized protein isoform X2 n=1 Tax=Hoplias malabaricus TaxID=27720 RepID=UPI00346199F4
MAENNGDVPLAVVENREILRAVVQHCRDMKRQETCSRFATGLLLLALFATFLLFHASGHNAKVSADKQPATSMGLAQAQKSKSAGSRIWSVHLLGTRGHVTFQNQSVLKHNMQVINWIDQQNTGQLKNFTDLYVPFNGWYLINLRMYYQVPAGDCPCKENLCYLTVIVNQDTETPPGWNIMTVYETIPCEVGTLQAVTLSRVVKLTKSSVLRVLIDPKNYNLVSSEKFSHFEVTRLPRGRDD